MKTRIRIAVFLLALSAALLCTSAKAATIYLCRAYSGGNFWSSVHCNQKQGLYLREFSVPDEMPFDQQVELSSQARNKSERHTNTTTTTSREVVRSSSTEDDGSAECAALDKQIRSLDAVARQPLSGQVQDQIRAKKAWARSRQFKLSCP